MDSWLYFVIFYYLVGEQSTNAIYFSITPNYAEVEENVQFECSEEGNFHTYSLAIEETECLYNCDLRPEIDHTDECISFHERLLGCELLENKYVFQIKVKNRDFQSYQCQGMAGGPTSSSLNKFGAAALQWKDSTFTHMENETFTLQCQATGGEPVTKALYLEIDENSNCNCTSFGAKEICTVNAKATKQMNGKHVYCTAYQAEGRSGINIKEKLNITYPPVGASVNDSVRSVKVEGNVDLNCYVNAENSGNPHSYNYIWKRNRDPDFNEQTSKGQLIITAHDECWDDTFKCCPENYAGRGNCGEIHVYVTVPANATVPSHKHTIYVDHELNLTCECVGKPSPAIEWELHDHSNLFSPDVSDGMESGDCMLLITKVSTLFWSENENVDRKMANGVKVTCSCQNSEEEPSKKDVTLDVQFPPGQASIDTDKSDININETLNLTCALNEENKGNPDHYKYKFFLNGTSLSDNWLENHQKKIGIKNITQEGEYMCQGRNEPDDTDPKPGEISNHITVTVFVIPEILQPTNETRYTPAHNDKEFAIHCRAFGKPEVNIELHKDDVKVDDWDFGGNIYSKPNSDLPYGLEIETRANFTWNLTNIGNTCVDRTYYDSNNYTCVATNDGTEQRTIMSEKIIINTKYSAVWNGSDYDVHAEYNASLVEIHCNICAYPKTNFSWAKESTDNILEGENNEILTLYNIDESDFGLYFCFSENEIGLEKFEIFLKIDDAPQLTNFSVTDKTSMSITVSWDVYSDGGHPPVIFEVSYRQSSKESYKIWSDDLRYDGDVNEETTFTETVKHLNATSFYQILVEAKNIRKLDNVTQKITSEQTLEPPEVTLQSATLAGKELTVKWSYDFTTFTAAKEMDYKVAVQVCYWHKDRPEQEEFYPIDSTIDASEKEVSFKDNDLTTQHIVQLLVFENGIQNEVLPDELVAIQAEPSSLGAGAIFGIVLIILLLASVIVIGFLVYTERLKLPFFQRETEDELHVSEGADNKAEYDNAAFDGNIAGETMAAHTGAAAIYALPDKSKKKGKQQKPATDKAGGVIYAVPDKGKKKASALDYETDERPYENVGFNHQAARPLIAPKPSKDDLKKKVEATETRYVDGDNCIYIKVGGLEFPKYKPTPAGQPPVIHGIENLTVYASIDFNARAPTPEPPPVYDEEEDIMGPLPDRSILNNDNQKK